MSSSHDISTEALTGVTGVTRVTTDRPLGSRCCANGVPGVLDDAKAKELAELLHLLGHPVRLQLLSILTRREGQVCVCDLEAALPVKQPTISHHLRLLREAGLIDSERHGQWAYYFVAPEALSQVRSKLLKGLGTLG